MLINNQKFFLDDKEKPRLSAVILTGIECVSDLPVQTLSAKGV
jgi:hypothetical protein